MKQWFGRESLSSSHEEDEDEEEEDLHEYIPFFKMHLLVAEIMNPPEYCKEFSPQIWLKYTVQKKQQNLDIITHRSIY